MENATSFGAQADVYRAARPSYPDELFDWIAHQAPGRANAWDVGTGSGQAAQALAMRFSNVAATDIDDAQIAAAQPHPQIRYAKAEAHASGLDDSNMDCITVATALHWFDHARFWKEVRRVARPGAIFCAWTYHRAIADDDVQSELMGPVQDLVEPYWAEGNRLSWRGYSADELGMPFDVLQTPEFICELDWTAAQITAFLNSWSAHKKAREDGHTAALADIENRALSVLGDKKRRFVMPLNMLAARIA